MKIKLFGYVIDIEVSKAVADAVQKRRRKAALVLVECYYSTDRIDRIKAVRQLGVSIFPELKQYRIDFGYIVGLKLATEWVESAFLENGKGGIA